MKFLASIAITAIASLLLQLVFPWWSLVIAALIVGVVFPHSGFSSFLSGLLGTAMVWLGYAYWIDVSTGSILSEKIAGIFHLGSPGALLLAGSMAAGIVGGFAALTGNALRKLF